MIHTIKQIAQALRDAEANPELRQVHGPYIDRNPAKPPLGVCATTAVAITLGGLDPEKILVNYESIMGAVPALAARVPLLPGKVSSLFGMLSTLNDEEWLPWSKQADVLDAIDPEKVIYPVEEASNDSESI